VHDTEVVDLTFNSSLDGAREKALCYRPPGATGGTLVVGLHTWSYDRFNQLEQMLPFCRERGWSLLLPEFRGPNLQENPRARAACASDLAQQDVLDAIASLESEQGFAADKVFLLGGSGGGHMALMLAARTPAFWSGVSSWVPITDLAAWHAENPDYSAHLEACCGGAPGSGAEADRQYLARSPLSYLPQLAQATLSVHHGRFDPVVSYRHTLKLVAELERHHPGNFFFEVFSGGHDIRYQVAFHWFDGLLAVDEGQGARLTG
jgi:dipeptidyl aminopeptidase/acylaminoacyl peptidase